VARAGALKAGDDAMRRALIVLAVVAVSACAGGRDVTPQMASGEFRASHCTRPLLETARLQGATTYEVAQDCADIANRASGVEAARARFYAGRAFFRGRPANLERAETFLRSALDTGASFVGYARNDPDDFSREARAARFELAQVYIQRGGASLASAERLLDEARARHPEDVGIPYLLAQLATTEKPEEGRAEAFQHLARVFGRSNLVDDFTCRTNCPSIYLRLDDATVRDGRRRLYELGMALGVDALKPRTETSAESDGRLARAVDYFQGAKLAVEAACLGVEPDRAIEGGCETDRTDAFYMSGITQLLAAGVPQDNTVQFWQDRTPADPGGLDCLEGVRRDEVSIVQAIAAFEAMQRLGGGADRSGRASWGRACASLARASAGRYDRNQMVQSAITDLSRTLSPDAHTDFDCTAVVQGASTRTIRTIVTLARAYVMGGEPARARQCFQKAIELGGFDGATITRLRLERARTYYFVRNDAGTERNAANPYVRTVEWIQLANDPDLTQAAADLEAVVESEAPAAGSAEDQARDEAAVALAHINFRFGDFQRAGALLAGRVNRRESELAAPAAYLLSRCLMVTHQQWLNDQWEVRQRRANERTDVNPEPRRCGSAPSVGDAQALALIAYQAQPSNPAYRRQACLTHIIFPRRARSEDARYCAADQERAETGDTGSYAEASFYEGMFWLRQALLQDRRSNQTPIWSRALQSFRRAEQYRTYDRLRWEPGVRSGLTNLIEFGLRYIQDAVGLVDAECANDGEAEFFRRHGVQIRLSCRPDEAQTAANPR